MLDRLNEFWIDCVKYGLACSVDNDTQQITFYKPNTAIVWTFADEVSREVQVGNRNEFGKDMQADDLEVFQTEMTFEQATKLLFDE